MIAQTVAILFEAFVLNYVQMLTLKFQSCLVRATVIVFVFFIPFVIAIPMPVAMMIGVLTRAAHLEEDAPIAWLFFTLNAVNFVQLTSVWVWMLRMKTPPEQEYSYQTMLRDKVDGPVRIGTELEIEGDIFSLAFAGCFKKELIAYFFLKETDEKEPNYVTDRLKLIEEESAKLK